VARVLAVLIRAFGWLVPAMSRQVIVRVYNLVWMIDHDVVKLNLQRVLDERSRRATKRLWRILQPLDMRHDLDQRRRTGDSGT
jgi:hypothetical protein